MEEIIELREAVIRNHAKKKNSKLLSKLEDRRFIIFCGLSLAFMISCASMAAYCALWSSYKETIIENMELKQSQLTLSNRLSLVENERDKLAILNNAMNEATGSIRPAATNVRDRK